MNRAEQDSRGRKDWVGKQFGNLTVAAYDGRRGGKHYWRCLCKCGKEAIVCQSNLKSSHTRSCGCLSDPRNTRHFVEGTCIESIRSRKVSASNKSGVRGVYFNQRSGRWIAQITFQGHTRYLGSFESLEEAAQVRKKAEAIFDDFLERTRYK
nr:AP2 domain-containing protein [uncultured Acetatifactor sp.]